MNGVFLGFQKVAEQPTPSSTNEENVAMEDEEDDDDSSSGWVTDHEDDEDLDFDESQVNKDFVFLLCVSVFSPLLEWSKEHSLVVLFFFFLWFNFFVPWKCSKNSESQSINSEIFRLFQSHHAYSALKQNLRRKMLSNTWGFITDSFCQIRNISLMKMECWSTWVCLLFFARYERKESVVHSVLGLKVGAGRCCIFCPDIRSRFATIVACQTHMRDKQHCKVNRDPEGMLEFAEYYDYRYSVFFLVFFSVSELVSYIHILSLWFAHFIFFI